jgi:hypothetical protein
VGSISAITIPIVVRTETAAQAIRTNLIAVSP